MDMTDYLLTLVADDMDRYIAEHGDDAYWDLVDLIQDGDIDSVDALLDYTMIDPTEYTG
jgi:hypothetical protein